MTSEKKRIEVRSENSHKGGTMRLGAYPCVLKEGTHALKAYGLKRNIRKAQAQI